VAAFLDPRAPAAPQQNAIAAILVVVRSVPVDTAAPRSLLILPDTLKNTTIWLLTSVVTHALIDPDRQPNQGEETMESKFDDFKLRGVECGSCNGGYDGNGLYTLAAHRIADKEGIAYLCTPCLNDHHENSQRID